MALPAPPLPNQSAAMRKATEHASLASSIETATRRRTPGPLPGVGSAAIPTTAAGSHQEGSPAMSARNHGPVEARETYAAVVCESPSIIQPSGRLKPTVNNSASSGPAASPEADIKRMSVCDMSGPLSGMNVGATIPNPQPANPSAVNPGARRNRTPIYITGVSDTRGVLAWLRSRCPNGISAKKKCKRLTVMPGTADHFWAAITAIRSLDVSKSVSLHTFSLPEDRRVRLLIKKLGRGMPETVVREELETLVMCPGSTRAPFRAPGPGSRKGPPCHPVCDCDDSTGS
jgi:hypothetical protein